MKYAQVVIPHETAEALLRVGETEVYELWADADGTHESLVETSPLNPSAIYGIEGTVFSEWSV